METPGTDPTNSAGFLTRMLAVASGSFPEFLMKVAVLFMNAMRAVPVSGAVPDMERCAKELIEGGGRTGATCHMRESLIKTVGKDVVAASRLALAAAARAVVSPLYEQGRASLIPRISLRNMEMSLQPSG